MSHQLTLWDTPNATSSPVLASGLTRSGWQDGPMIARSGRDLARASLSARQAKEKGLMTSATCGQLSPGSSASLSLQLLLVSRLQARLSGRGSTAYAMTWRPWITPARRQLSRLAASAHLISGQERIGLPTPSGTSNHGKNHVAGRLDEWGGSSNPFRGTDIGGLHSPSFEAWMMGIPVAWVPLMRSAMQSLPRKRRRSSKATSK